MSVISAHRSRPAASPRLRVSTLNLAPLLLGLLFFGVSGGFAVAQHLTFHTRARDMGIYVQILWNAAQGRPFISTLLQENTNHLAEHVAPSLWPLVPLAGLVPDAVPLLVLQQLFLAACGLPVYLLARARLGRAGALVVLLGFYLMPALSRVSLSEFHPIKLAALPVAAGVALALSGWPRSGALLLLLALLFEEETAPTVAGAGVVLLLLGLWRRVRERRGTDLTPRPPLAVAARAEQGEMQGDGAPTPARSQAPAIGMVLAGVAVAWLLLVVLVVMPAFRLPARDQDETANRALSHYEQVQEEPNVVWTWLAAERGPDALSWLVLPHGGLALLAPEVLAIALPGFIVLFLQDRAGTYAGHWSAPLLPVIWLAVAVGLGRLAARPPLLRASLVLLVVGTAAAYPLDSYFPGGRAYEADHYEMTALESSLRQAVERVPPGTSLVATRRVVPHLAARSELYQFPFTFYDAPLRPEQQRQEYYILDLTDSQTHRAVEPSESDSVLEKRPRYHLQRFGPSVLLLSKAQPEPEQPADATFDGTLRLLGLSWPGGPAERWSSDELSVGLFWTALGRAAGEPVRSLRLLGPDGAVVAEASGQVVDDYLRFRDWDRGQVVAEWITLQPAGPLPTGTYRLMVGWQDASGRPLPLDGSGDAELELARIERR